MSIYLQNTDLNPPPGHSLANLTAPCRWRRLIELSPTEATFAPPTNQNAAQALFRANAAHRRPTPISAALRETVCRVCRA